MRISRFFQWRFRRPSGSPSPAAGSGSGHSDRSIVLERELPLPVERNRLGDHYPVYFRLRFGLLKYSVRLFVDARLPAETGLEFRAEARMMGAPLLNFLLEYLYRRNEGRLMAALDKKANEIYLEALARRPGQSDVGIPLDEYDEPDYRPNAWSGRFPSENPDNFREPFSARAFFRKAIGKISPPGNTRVESPPQKQYLRRITIIPMPADADAVRALLPPTFIYPVRAEPVLYLTAALDAGRGTELPSGREDRIIISLHCPAGLIQGGDYHEGWLPLFSTWTPCLRPTLPGDPYTIGYPFQAGGLRLGLGDARRQAMWMNSYTPTRVIQARDTLPGIIAQERNVFRRETGALNIINRSETLDFAVNRVYFMRRTPPLIAGAASHGPRARGAAAWFSQRFGIQLQEVDHGYFLTSLITQGQDNIIPLHLTHFRSTGPAHPGRPVLDREKAGII